MLGHEGKEHFPNIFKQGKIGRYTIPNRIKHAACSVSNYNSPQGFVTDREIYRDEVIGKCGAGILTNQGAYPDPKGEGKAYWRQLALYDERFIPGLRRVAELWQRDSPYALILQQILHAGRYGGFDLDYSLMPSIVPQKTPHFGRPPKEMTIDDIERMKAEHARAAGFAIQAGFAGVELTSFQGYLLANFNSRYTNRRKDRYGGSLENRGRFMVELIQAIRKVIGLDRVLGTRLPGTELLGDEGNSDEECLEIARMAEDAGVDYLSITVGWHESPEGAIGRMYQSDQWLYLCENWKKRLKLPLTFGVELQDPFVAERALAEGVMDYWEVCRPMLADPDRLHKIARNDLKAIRPCIGLDLMCLAKGLLNQPYVCTVNPVLGHEGEDEFRCRPATRKKLVMVIGGGPSGLETALAAAQKGHWVSIYERKARLGGQLLSLAKDPNGGERLNQLIGYYEEQIRRANIEVHLDVNVDAQLIDKIHPEVIVLATGSKIGRPPVPGIEGENVYTTFEVMERGKEPQGYSAAVIHGGKVGIVTALYLAALGKKVFLIHEGKRVDEKVTSTWRWRYQTWLAQSQIQKRVNRRLVKVSEQGVTLVDEEGKEDLLKVDAVVLAKRESNQDLFDFVELNSDEFFVVGDCIRPGYLIRAIHEGYKIGCRI
jgi:2,4-dienoyl-CoA reductase (NADPH2)